MKLTQDNCYKLALEITGCNGMEWPFFSSKILEFNNLELLHALVTCATPSQHLALWHHEKRSQEFIFKVSMIESILSVCDGYLIKSPETEYLDASEKSVTSYYLGLIFTKLFSMKEFQTDYFLSTTLFEQVYGKESFICNGRKKTSFVGLTQADGKWSIWEPTGKRDHAPKALSDAFNQVLGIKSVNGQAPTFAMASMTYFDTKHNELQGILRNAPEGKKADVHFDKEQFLTLYYRHICELFDESLRLRPFDSVIDYIDGYLEIELELFGLNIDEHETDEYARKRRVKLGVPKKILEYFQYHTPAAKQEILLSDIVDAIPDNEPELQDSHFFMGRDKIYFRIV